MPNIRCLQESDLTDCLRLKTAAGWNQTETDWRALLAASPEGCFGAEVDGRVEATATAVIHEGVAWIGMVLTAPAMRGQGLATALMTRALEWTDARGVATVKLDATAQGEPLYRKLGFAAETPIERWAGVYDGAPAELSGSYSGPKRHHAAVPADATVDCDGAWAAGRAGSEAWYFGPCYAATAGDAERVARRLLAGRGRVFWDLFPDHAAAEIAARLGLAPARRLLRMVRGKAAPTPSDVYAIAGFEWG